MALPGAPTFAFSPPKSYGTSHPTGNDPPGKLPQIPTPLDAVQPETVGLAPTPKV